MSGSEIDTLKRINRLKPALHGLIALAMATCVHAQTQRAPAEWVTSGSDAQRTHSVAANGKISVAEFAGPNFEKPGFTKSGFEFLWKRKLAGDGDAMTQAVLMDRYIGYRGFRSLAFIAATNGVYAIDTDLNRMEWEKKWPAAAGPARCAGLGIGRSTFAMYPPIFGPERSGFAKSDVGQAHEGAVTIAVALRAASVPTGAPRPPDRGPRPAFIYTIGGDGKLHSMYLSNGDEPEPPMDFVPPNSNAHGFVMIDNSVAYAATNECNGAEGGIWALDIRTNQSMHWKSSSGKIAGSGGMAFGPTGVIYLTTTGGELVALDGQSLAPRDSYRAGGEFVSSAVVFPYRNRTMVAAATKDGTLHVVDGAAVNAVLFKSQRNTVGAATGELASWQSAAGVRWLAAATERGVETWRIGEREDVIALEEGWKSRQIESPMTPMIVNGVVFVLARGDRARPAVLHALDGSTGAELWNSGKTITSFADSGGLSAGGNQIYFSTHDGTIYAFGFPIEH